MRLLLTGGGTGGHVYPGLTLLNYMYQKLDHVEVLYIGSERGLEKDIVGRTDIPFETIPAAGLRRQISLSGMKTAWTTYRGYRKAKRLIAKFRPDVVLGTGGYVTLPVVFAASKLGVPSVVWEANARPGLTNQLCAGKAYGVAVAFDDSERYFSKARKVVYTGNPRASEVSQVTEDRVHKARDTYQIDPQKKLIVSFAGSRGAETVNRVLLSMMEKFASTPQWQFVYVTGDAHYDDVVKQVKNVPDNVRIVPFIHDMPALMPMVDAMVARAGGSTLAEVCAFGVPSVLIPSPFVTANHQEQNARRLADRGAALMLREDELNPSSLWSALERVVDTKDKEEIRRRASEMATPNAVHDLYELVMEAAASRRRR